MPFQPIKTSLKFIITLGLTCLTACAASPESQPSNAMRTETKGLELSAHRALQLGEYRNALNIYEDAYSNYSSIDDTHSMLRQLVNMTQVALLIEDLEKVDTLLEKISLLSDATNNADYLDRSRLLHANLAIAQQQWAQALAQLELVNLDTNSELYDSVVVSRLITQVNLGNSVDIQSIKSAIQQEISYARIARLSAEQALDNNDNLTARIELDTAQEIYRDLGFQPGIAECLILEARINEMQSNPGYAQILRQRAKNIWLRLGNQRAIQRHNL